MGDMTFSHIHCSSSHNRPAGQLERDLDDWMARFELITMTEIDNDNRSAKLREKGWGHYNARKSQGQDECAVAWDLGVWLRKWAGVRRLTDRRFYRENGKLAAPTHSCSVVLLHRSSGKRVLVSVTHLPAHVEGRQGWNTTMAHWQGRKAAYLGALHGWAVHVKDLERKHRTDGTLLVADWNLNLKHNWVRNLLMDVWGRPYHQAWTRFPTAGGSMSGGPPYPPLGAPGVDTGDRIIDGSLYRHLDVSLHPNLMARVPSSDHRPYREEFRLLGRDENPKDEGGGKDQGHGDTKKGDPWWGFGDYLVDEIYDVTRATEGSET